MNTLMWVRVKDLHYPNDKKPVGTIFRHKLIPLTVVISKATLENGDVWKHVAASRKDRLPTWVELSKVKQDFIGSEKEAFHIMPKESDYIDLYFFCFHIWSPLESETQFPNLKKVVLEQPI